MGVPSSQARQRQGTEGLASAAFSSAGSAIMTDRARRLRAEMTPYERILWKHLRRSALGCRFRRQHVLGCYIVDFACLERRLVIEVDGCQHAEQQSYDEQRTRWLTAEGYRVLRFTNDEVHSQLEAVVEEIRRYSQPG
jgi:very-short-patch-repair endonuclease